MKECKIKNNICLGATLTCVIILCLTATSALGAGTVKIGAGYPLSGGVAEAASWAVEGVKMATEEINNDGGLVINGKKYKIELKMYDTKCDPTTGINVAEKMINRDNVNAISGGYCSSVSLAQREISNSYKVVQLTPISVNPKITEPGYPYMFRLCNTIQMYAEPMVDFVAEKTDINSISMMAITDDYGRSAVDSYSKLFDQYKIEVLDIEYFKHGDKDFYTQLTKIVESDPDGIYIVTDEDSQNIGILKQLNEIGFDGIIIGCSTYNTDNMLELGGSELLEGMYTEAMSYELFKNTPEVQKWNERYEKMFGREGNAFSLWGYQSIKILAKAIEKSGDVDGKEKIKDAMYALNLDEIIGYHGKKHFDKNGQTHPYIGVVQYQNGERVPVHKVIPE